MAGDVVNGEVAKFSKSKSKKVRASSPSFTKHLSSACRPGKYYSCSTRYIPFPSQSKKVRASSYSFTKHFSCSYKQLHLILSL